MHPYIIYSNDAICDAARTFPRLGPIKHTNPEQFWNNCKIVYPSGFNIQKCEFLTVGTQPRSTKFKDVNIKIDEIDIVKVTTSKYLGFIIDQHWGGDTI